MEGSKEPTYGHSVIILTNYAQYVMIQFGHMHAVQYVLYVN